MSAEKESSEQALPEKPRSPLVMVVLAQLAEGPMHAYRMQQLIRNRRKDAVVNIARSNSVYQAIDRLLRDDLIRVKETLATTSGPGRIVYEITTAGREVLTRWMETMLSTPAREFPEFPAVLAMVAILTPRLVRRELEKRVPRLTERIEEIRGEMKVSADMGLPRVLWVEDEYKLAMARAELAWVRGLVDDLASGELHWSERQLREISTRFES